MSETKPLSEWSDEELRVRVAELCGWTAIHLEGTVDFGKGGALSDGTRTAIVLANKRSIPVWNMGETQ